MQGAEQLSPEALADGTVNVQLSGKAQGKKLLQSWDATETAWPQALLQAGWPLSGETQVDRDF